MSQAQLTPFDFEDLPDLLSQAEALWHLTALSYSYAIGIGYLVLMNPPDKKAAYNIERSCEYLERSIRRAYSSGEAEFLIALARKKAWEGVKAQDPELASAGVQDRTLNPQPEG